MRDWGQELISYQDFLSAIDLKKYSHYRNIKWVEQDLPQDKVSNLYVKNQKIKFRHLHLESIYFYYWHNNYRYSFEEWFETYWDVLKTNEDTRVVLEKFKEYYFDGADDEWFKRGFCARLYRTWISLLTQIHFQYLWNSLFPEKLEASASLDSLGIDARCSILGKTVGIQVKKISFRREASERRFGKKLKKCVDIFAEVPYLVDDPEEIEQKLKRGKTKSQTTEKLEKYLNLFRKNFLRYPNGFIVFKSDYLRTIYHKITEAVKNKVEVNTINYEKFYSY